MNRPEHFAAYRGKLAGKIVMVTLPGDGQEPTDPPFHRLTSEEISKEDKYQVPHFDPDEQNGFLKRIDFYRQMDKFLAAEGALAVVKKARTDGKLVFGDRPQAAFVLEILVQRQQRHEHFTHFLRGSVRRLRV